MKISNIVLVVFTVLLITGCNRNRVYVYHDDNFPKFRWEKTRKVGFSPEITEPNFDYKIYFALRHVFGFQFDTLKINIEVISPSGEKSNKDYTIKVRDQYGDYLSDCQGSYCDLESLIEDKYKFPEAGTYKFIVRHQAPLELLPNVMEVGLIVEKNE